YNFNVQLAANNSVNLQWMMSEESNIASYTIEKSGNGKDWQLLSLINPDERKQVYNYSINDANPLPGTSYYRLKIVQKDGKVQMSDLKKVEIKTIPFEFTISPNPAVNDVTLQISSDITTHANLQILNTQVMVMY